LRKDKSKAENDQDVPKEVFQLGHQEKKITRRKSVHLSSKSIITRMMDVELERLRKHPKKKLALTTNVFHL